MCDCRNKRYNSRTNLNSTFMQKHSRLPFIDAMKGLGCLAIVLHHLAFYGPMSDVVGERFPLLVEGLILYARLVVQTFFVLAGFMVASQLAPELKTIHIPAASFIWKRYKRLITPFLFAIACATLITALVRPWFTHDSLSEAPSITQLIAHGLLVHDLLDFQALSAGVWFIAIDFQLFVCTVLLTALTNRCQTRWRIVFPILIIALSAISLWIVNRYSQYENDAPFYFGSYGLGMLAYWSTRPTRGSIGLLIICALGGIALALEFRKPVAVALASAVLVSIASQAGWLARWPKPGVLTWLGQRSYSIFLIHYGICIGFNAIWSKLFPTGVWLNAMGMLAALLASVAAGALLYRYVESRPRVFGKNIATYLLGAAVTGALIIESISW